MTLELYDYVANLGFSLELHVFCFQLQVLRVGGFLNSEISSIAGRQCLAFYS